MTLQDSPWRITFDTNPDDCNLHCIMCEGFSKYSHQNHSSPRRMDIQIIEKVIEEMAPIGLTEVIPSTMGEPLLYDHFEEIIALCRKFSLKLNVTTNGTWPRKDPQTWAEKICPVTSDIKISWNSADKKTQEEIMPISLYEKRLSELKLFVKTRDKIAESGNYCRITLQATFMERNLQGLPALIKLAADIGADRVKGHHLWVNFPELREQDLRRNDDSIARWNAKVKLCEKEMDEHNALNGKQMVLENFTDISKDYIVTGCCPFLGKEAWISTDGTFNPCCAPDEERKSLGYFGNVKDAGLRALWTSEEYQKLVKQPLANKICQKCNMRKTIKSAASQIGLKNENTSLISAI